MGKAGKSKSVKPIRKQLRLKASSTASSSEPPSTRVAKIEASNELDSIESIDSTNAEDNNAEKNKLKKIKPKVIPAAQPQKIANLGSNTNSAPPTDLSNDCTIYFEGVPFDSTEQHVLNVRYRFSHT